VPASPSNGPPSAAARSVVCDIDRELDRLAKYEKAVASERELSLRARAVLTNDGGSTLTGNRGATLRARVSHTEILAHLGAHPGCSAEQIADALQARLAAVTPLLFRGRGTRYECREDGWYLYPQPG